MMPHHMHLQQRRLFSGIGSDSSSQISAISTGTPAPLCEQITRKRTDFTQMWKHWFLSPELVQPYTFQFTYGSSISIYNQIAKLIWAQDGQLSPHLIFDKYHTIWLRGKSLQKRFPCAQLIGELIINIYTATCQQK